ncbi:hypothetical protein [uncultured Desulfosarcina sp.]|uniref:hypothetical protein n=1 Tax=uncultured Desulfosarcina sp. TaxID=218289 RepID=UPI0029C63ED3|nr:hypothetical protein [uncultured Desulfosarcina sp.]
MQRSQSTNLHMDLVGLVVALILFGSIGSVFSDEPQWSPTAAKQEESGQNGYQKKVLGVKIGPPMTGQWTDAGYGQTLSTKWTETVPVLKDSSSNKPSIVIGGEFSLDLSEWMELKVSVDFSSDLYDDQVTGIAGMNINF